MISAIIITKNEAKMLPGCLKTLQWVDEVVVVDSESQDDTVNIAQKTGARVITVPDGTDYATSRNSGKKVAKGDWLIYVDADERVSPELKKEIISATSYRLQTTSYRIPRQNFMLGKWLKHGGFWPDYVHRLFHQPALVKWTGKLHESPTVKGDVGFLKTPIKHYTARTVKGAMAKSARWVTIEAQLFQQANVPKVVWWKPIKAFMQQFLQVFIFKHGWKDGTRGFILAYIQAFHQMSVLVRLWELQRKP